MKKVKIITSKKEGRGGVWLQKAENRKQEPENRRKKNKKSILSIFF